MKEFCVLFCIYSSIVCCTVYYSDSDVTWIVMMSALRKGVSSMRSFMCRCFRFSSLTASMLNTLPDVAMATMWEALLNTLYVMGQWYCPFWFLAHVSEIRSCNQPNTVTTVTTRRQSILQYNYYNNRHWTKVFTSSLLFR